MKFEPFWLLGAVGATSVAAAPPGASLAFYENIAAVFLGGALAMIWSWRRSRREGVDGTETSLQAMIAFLGAAGLAFFMSPMLVGHIVMGVPVPKPLLSFIIAVSGHPIIEWLLSGGGFAWAKKFLPKGDTQ